MNALTPFVFENNSIRVIDQNGDPWFVLRDLLDSMGSSTPTAVAVDSIKQGLGEGFNNVIPLQTAGGEQQTIIVAESAATYLVARSNTERGRKLNRFIHVEVLPSIRKTGGYQVTPMQPFTTEQRAAELTPAFVLAAKAFGFEGNQAILSADKAVRAITGFNFCLGV